MTSSYPFDFLNDGPLQLVPKPKKPAHKAVRKKPPNTSPLPTREQMATPTVVVPTPVYAIPPPPTVVALGPVKPHTAPAVTTAIFVPTPLPKPRPQDPWYTSTSIELTLAAIAALLAIPALIYAGKGGIFLLEEVVLTDIKIRKAYKTASDNICHQYWSKHSDDALQQALKSFDATVQAAIQRATALFDQADRLERANFEITSDFVRIRAHSWTDRAKTRQDYLENMQAYFDQIIQDRRNKLLAVLIATIAAPDDTKATAALAELYKLRTQIDWDTLIPPHVTNNDRVTVEKAYQRMAGTTSINEARTAWTYIQRATGATP